MHNEFVLIGWIFFITIQWVCGYDFAVFNGGIFAGAYFFGQVLAVQVVNQIPKRKVNPARRAVEHRAVVIVVNADEPNAPFGEFLLQIIPDLQIRASPAG